MPRRWRGSKKVKIKNNAAEMGGDGIWNIECNVVNVKPAKEVHRDRLKGFMNGINVKADAGDGNGDRRCISF